MPNKKVDDFRVSGTVHDKRVKLTVSDKIDIINNSEWIEAILR